MAAILDSQLLKLPVFTKSGIKLGKVAGFRFETESQIITHYEVAPKGMAARLVGGDFLIGREQVISVDDEKMVVDDNTEKAFELAKAKAIGLVSSDAA